MLDFRSIAFELTGRCNQRCLYCYNAWRESGTGGPPVVSGDDSAAADLPTASVCALIDRVLADTRLTQITLTGGEPFLRPDLYAIIDHINTRGLSVAIISNGGLVTETAGRELAKRRVDYVQVTLGGADAHAHDALCGPGSFERLSAAVGHLTAAGVGVGGSYLCTRPNHATALDTLERMFTLGIRHHYAFNRFNPSGRGASSLETLMPTRSQVLAALAGANQFGDSHDLNIHCTMPVPPCMVDESQYPRIKFGSCSAGTAHAEYAIDPRGNLKLCTLQREPIGSLLANTFAGLLQSGAAERFRAATPEFCRDCPYRETCRGGCGAAAQWASGKVDEVDPFLGQHL